MIKVKKDYHGSGDWWIVRTNDAEKQRDVR
jgi:glutamate-1-semialdehyde aminotransferase